MLKYLLVCVLFVGAAKAQDEAGSSPRVELSGQGTVVGHTVLDGNFEYVQYLGIPYAGSTAGANRFKAPTAPPVFEEEFIADKVNIRCVHQTNGGYEGTENCLVADLYVPAEVNSSLSVMVWIQGSEFLSNNNALSFRHLIEKDVIVVVLNYRVSIFGFLCLGVDEAPGNAGLKDVITGLRWIKNNIAEFGGDPNSVTLFGHGTAAAVVDLVTLSPLSEGLVHKAISQSGSSTAAWSISYDPRINAVAVAEKLGHVIQDDTTLAEIFHRASVGVIMEAVRELELTDNTLAFAACVENTELDIEAAVVVPPHDLIMNGSYNQIPFITGFVQNEGTIRAQQALEDDWLEKMEVSFTDFIQQDLEFETPEELQQVAENIRDYYFQGRSVDMSSIMDFVKYHGDTLILISAIRNARIRSETSNAPIYLYQFSYEGALGEPFVGPLSVEGATHGEDLAYLFDIGVTTEPGNTDIIVRDNMITRWTNFAKTGNPNSEILQTDWMPVQGDAINFLQIYSNGDLETIDVNVDVALVNPHSERVSFWDNIYEDHYRTLKTGWEPNAREDDDDEEVVPDPEENTPNPDEEEEDNGVDEEETENDAPRIIALFTSVLATSLLVLIFN